jgi:UrcA family protein
MYRTIAYALAAFVIAATFAPATLAEPAPAQASMRITYHDLDMSTLQGGKILLGRVEAAAHKICEDAARRAKPDENMTYRCRRRTVQAVVRSINNHLLTRAWSGEVETRSLASR